MITFFAWVAVGVGVAMLLSTRLERRNTARSAALLPGIFGALVGGVLFDQVPGVALNELTLVGMLGAVGGAMVLCFVARSKPLA